MIDGDPLAVGGPLEVAVVTEAFNETVANLRAVGAAINYALFEPRAMVDVQLWIASEVSETGTVIDVTDFTTQIPGITDLTVTVPKP